MRKIDNHQVADPKDAPAAGTSAPAPAQEPSIAAAEAARVPAPDTAGSTGAAHDPFTAEAAGVPVAGTSVRPTAAPGPFTAAAEAANCERILGHRRHGLDSMLGRRDNSDA